MPTQPPLYPHHPAFIMNNMYGDVKLVLLYGLLLSCHVAQGMENAIQSSSTCCSQNNNTMASFDGGMFFCVFVSSVECTRDLCTRPLHTRCMRTQPLHTRPLCTQCLQQNFFVFIYSTLNPSQEQKETMSVKVGMKATRCRKHHPRPPDIRRTLIMQCRHLKSRPKQVSLYMRGCLLNSFV